jgi:hypothetical protein
MRITRRYWLLLGILIGLSGCSPARTPAPDSPRPPGPILTPPDAPAEPTFKPDVPPRLMRDIRPLSHSQAEARSNAGGWRQRHRGGRPTLEDEG